MTRYFLDNDVVLKSAQYGLLEELSHLCGGADRIFILPTLRFRFHLNNDDQALHLLGSQGALTRLREFVRSTNEITYADSTLVEAIQDVPQVDAGEAVLFAAALADDSSFTFTGDKRAVESLFQSKSTQEIVKRLVGRIKCFEQVVAEMMLRFDVVSLIERIQGRPWDTSLRACYSSGNTETIREGLQSYHRDLNRKCGNALAPFPGAI